MDLITEEDSRTRKAFFDIHEVRPSDQTPSSSHRNCHLGRSVVSGHVVHGGLYGGTKVFSPPLISNRHLAHTLTYLGEGRNLLISNAAVDRHDCTQHHRRPSPSFASPDLRKSTTGGPDFNRPYNNTSQVEERRDRWLRRSQSLWLPYRHHFC